MGHVAIIVFLAGFLLDGISGNHRSLEEIVVTSGISVGNNSIVFSVGSSRLSARFPRVVESISGNLDHVLIESDVIIHGDELANGDLRLKLDIGPVGVFSSSLVSLADGVIAISLLDTLVISMPELSVEIPDLSGGV